MNITLPSEDNEIFFEHDCEEVLIYKHACIHLRMCVYFAHT